MAKPEHLKKLDQGKDDWNRWREEHPDERPDLSGADLRRRMLRRFDLSDANLRGSDLRDTSFRSANLSAARLDGAKLYRCLLSGTKLQGASFYKTVLYETVFANVDLSTVANLAECIHKGPSVIDHRTLTRSRALPLNFLRGCGLPDEVISQAMRSESPLMQYWSCFISYSSLDQAFADRIYDDLQSNGVRCWFAPKDLPIGARIRDAIDEAIRETGKLLLVLSANSMGSNWVEKEFETAFEEEKRRNETILFPIRLDSSPFESTRSWIADIRRTTNIGDFSRWKDDAHYKDAFAGLLRGLQRNVQREK